jgi:ectoine hydroxylase-related dioxygenase (phytanoyl-CoA dioxygenase family)
MKVVAPIWLGRQRRQLLHHEDGLWPAAPHPGHEYCVDGIWALDDFAPGNGATLVIPGRWARPCSASSSEGEL